MYTSILFSALLATLALAGPIEKRFDKERVTQYSSTDCSGDSIHETKGWGLSCVEMQGTAGSFSYDMGSGPKGASNLKGFSTTSCVTGDTITSLTFKTSSANCQSLTDVPYDNNPSDLMTVKAVQFS
ncbi:hypothetical protein MMC09_005744 [Bachmanniomyces sp. S44760]|nr:hypothetical protein [Bachmanniomyces sp. S44760]